MLLCLVKEWAHNPTPPSKASNPLYYAKTTRLVSTQPLMYRIYVPLREMLRASRRPYLCSTKGDVEGKPYAANPDLVIYPGSGEAASHDERDGISGDIQWCFWVSCCGHSNAIEIQIIQIIKPMYGKGRWPVGQRCFITNYWWHESPNGQIKILELKYKQLKI